MYFDKLWATQHLTFAFLGAFTTSMAYCFPVRYSDVLHRASLHLGTFCSTCYFFMELTTFFTGIWNKTSTRNHPPPIPWNKSIIWPFGTYVKYSGDVYRSNSNSTCATPANNSHYRFYVNIPRFLLYLGIFNNFFKLLYRQSSKIHQISIL